VSVSLIWLQDFNKRFFFFVMRFQWRSAFVPLWDFKDGQFCFITRSQWRSVLLGYEILMTVNEMLMTVGFVPLQDFYDGRFCSVTSFQWRSVLFGYGISVTAVFFFLVSRSEWLSEMMGYEISVLFLNKILMTVHFVPLQDFYDERFCSVMRSQWQSVLFH